MLCSGQLAKVKKSVIGMNFLTIGVVLLALAGLLDNNEELTSVGMGAR